MAALACALPCGAAWIEDVEPRYLDVRDFQYLRELFTGEEHSGARTILRTDAQVREGLYVVVRFGERPAAGSVLVLELLGSDALEPQTWRFELEERPRHAHLYLGLTGADWPDRSRKVMAWALRLEDASGQLLERVTSFLWEMPETPAEAAAAPSEVPLPQP